MISLIIPMYNEISIAADTAKALDKYMRENFADFEIIFCDDGSTDDCADAIKALSLPGMRVIGYEMNRGKGCAVRTGMLASHGDIAVFTDCDLAYGTEVIKRLYDALDNGSGSHSPQIAIGSRRLEKGSYGDYSPLRTVASSVYSFILRTVGGLQLTDFQCGCKAFTRYAADRVFSASQTDGFAFDYEALLIADKMGIDTVEIPVKIINHRESKINLIRDSLNMLSEIRRIKRRTAALKADASDNASGA